MAHRFPLTGFFNRIVGTLSRCRKPARAAFRRTHSPTLEQMEDRTVPSTTALDLVGQESVARLWNESLLDAIRIDTPRPTVHARNLFHTSVAMYDAWAAYDPSTAGYLHNEMATASDVESARAEAISFAAYRVLSTRFANSPGAAVSLDCFDDLMDRLDQEFHFTADKSFTGTAGNSPAAVGNRIAQTVLQFGLTDGSNEVNNFADTSGYQPSNSPLVVSATGTEMNDPNLWQPLTINGTTQRFLTPHWGDVSSFALTTEVGDVHYDPGVPPQLGGVGDAKFKEAIMRVIRFSSWLDPDQGVDIDISPAAIGNNPLGTNDGTGHGPTNPVTGETYSSNVVNRGDYGRALAEFWADGPNSETPPGHWNAIANEVSENLTVKQIGGTGPVVNDLEWDVKMYFALNGAVHDAAIAAWDVKEAYDYVRPISMVRYMGGLGQSSDPNLPSFHPDGLPLETGLVEVITSDSTAAGGRHEHLAGREGEIAIFAWNGHPDANDPDGVGGVGWVLAEDWLPYQAANFVTPGFAGYVSGHSTFSRASAEVLTNLTGSPYFPGGLGQFTLEEGGLTFESGPTVPIVLQWATYYDAADEAGISRLYGGIHVDADDFEGRIMGSRIGLGAYQRAVDFFNGDSAELMDLTVNNEGTTTVRLNNEVIEVVDGSGQILLSESAVSLRSLAVNGGGRGDTLVVDFASGGFFAISGGIFFNGEGSARDRVVVIGTDRAESVELAANTVRVNNLMVNAVGTENLRIEGRGGNDLVTVGEHSFARAIEIDLGEGDDTYSLPTTQSRLYLIDGEGTDHIDFSGAPAGIHLDLDQTHGQRQFVGSNLLVHLHGKFEDVTGTPFTDYIRGSRADNRLSGGGGDDYLDGGHGNDLMLGGDGDDLVSGGRGDDILAGGIGADLIFGGHGDDVMIGGFGPDILFGLLGDDVLIGGPTVHDADPLALNAIHDEWTAPRPFDDRVRNLEQGGGENGTFVLSRGETVYDDRVRDILLAGFGRDWTLAEDDDLSI